MLTPYEKAERLSYASTKVIGEILVAVFHKLASGTYQRHGVLLSERRAFGALLAVSANRGQYNLWRKA